MATNRFAIVLGAIGLTAGFAIGAAAISELPFANTNYSDVYMDDNMYDVYGKDDRCVSGVDARTGRPYGEIQRCGDYDGVSDEQVIIAQRSRADTLASLARRKCAKVGVEDVQCRLAKRVTAAVQHTPLIQIAEFIGEPGDGTVQLAEGGEVRLLVSDYRFTTPETELLAEHLIAEGHQLARAVPL